MSRFDLGVHCEWAVPMVGGKTDVVENFFIGIRKGRIEAARPFKPSDIKSSRKFLRKKNMVVVPGFINGHAHLAMTMMKGLAEDLPLHRWLFEKIIPFENQHVRQQYVITGTELAALECLRFGTTTVFDHYFFPAAAAQVWDKAGLRGTFSQCCNSDKTPEDGFLKGDFEERFWALHKKYKNHERIRIALGPHAPYTCSDELLKRCAQISEKAEAPIQIHLSESEKEVNDSLAQFSMRPAQRLHKLGILGPRTTCAHSIYISESEMELLKKTKTSVIYNPDSNAKLGSGVAPLPLYHKLKIPVGLGTDGSATNNDLSLFGAMDLGAKIQKLFNKDPSAVCAADLLRHATYEGAHAIGLGHLIGSIEEGKRADLAIVDFNFPHLQPVHDVINHLVYSCQGLEVDTVICDGRVLRDGSKWTTMKPQVIYKKAEIFRKSIAKEVRNSL